MGAEETLFHIKPDPRDNFKKTLYTLPSGDRILLHVNSKTGMVKAAPEGVVGLDFNKSPEEGNYTVATDLQTLFLGSID